MIDAPSSTWFTAAPHWQWYIVLYFFIGGLAGGCYFIATLIDQFGRAEDRPIARFGYYVAFRASIETYASDPTAFAEASDRGLRALDLLDRRGRDGDRDRRGGGVGRRLRVVRLVRAARRDARSRPSVRDRCTETASPGRTSSRASRIAR